MERDCIESNSKKSRLPARLDLLQSVTGLVLGLFVWVHIFLDASIILGPDAFHWVSRNLELAFLSDTGHGYPLAVFFAVFIIFTLFILHALLGTRKFPSSWKQHRILKDQMAMLKHRDTDLWYVQAVTGFILFFAGSVHLYTILTHPGSIDPYLCADRVVYDHYWFVYLVLLVCVALHGNIGLYRLCMKWGWFQGKDYHQAKLRREKFKRLRNKLIIVFLCVGLLALLVFVIVGLTHKEAPPTREPAYLPQTHEARPHRVEPKATKPLVTRPLVKKPVVEKAPEAFNTHPEQVIPKDNAPSQEAHRKIEEPFHEDPVHQETLKEKEGQKDTAHQEIINDETVAPPVEKDEPHTAPPALFPPEPVETQEAGNQLDALQETLDDTLGGPKINLDGLADPQELDDDPQTVQEIPPDEPVREQSRENDRVLESETHPIQAAPLHIKGGYGPEETL